MEDDPIEDCSEGWKSQDSAGEVGMRFDEEVLRAIAERHRETQRDRERERERQRDRETER